MQDSAAFEAGVAQGNTDAVNMQSTPTPPEYDGNVDYAAGYEQGRATPSGPVSTPEPTDPSEIYAAGVAHGAEDRANQSSSPTSPELEDRKEYQEGDTYGSDPDAYAAGEQAGRADTIHKRSSATPPEYEGNAAYAQGYADGLAAPPLSRRRRCRGEGRAGCQHAGAPTARPSAEGARGLPGLR